MLYILQVIVYTGLMLLIYLLLLRDKPMHQFNRRYLLVSSVLPLILPLLKLPEAFRPQQAADTVFTGILPEVIIGAGERHSDLVLPSWLPVTAILYLGVVLVFIIIKVSAYIKMRRLIGRSEREDNNGYVLLKQTGYGPGSWGRYIFLPEGDVDNTIIQHEQVHIRLHHSRDIIFMNAVQAIMWPNIFLHLLKKELVQVHEFQADAAVHMDAENYSRLLLSSVFGTDKLYLAHSFINHPIKRRIMMLHKNRTSGKLRGIVASLLAVIVLAGIITMQSCEQKKETVLTEPPAPSKTDALTYAYKMPEFKDGGAEGVYDFLAKTVKYPEEAKNKGIQGRVNIKFIVDENGKIRDAQVAGTKKTDPLLVKAALDAVAQMPDWTPGEDSAGNKVPVWYTLPITFKLDDEPKAESKKTSKVKEPLRDRTAGTKMESNGVHDADNKSVADKSQVSTTYTFESTKLTPDEVDHKLHNGGLKVKMGSRATKGGIHISMAGKARSYITPTSGLRN